ncbi:MAG: bacillithiol biosynthesis deacetylase BshB1 [Candidatus Hinthialibacter antarcticus]|nr:bacillithiol biosynthesis deacetylase BshB1 [Candidatus Hinthialibacter antarcticus]
MNQTKSNALDLLVFAPHPDDAELAMGGTLAKAIAQGKRCGIVDLTRGELGSKGNAEIRAQEAKTASDVLRLDLRDNLDLGDGRVADTEDNRRKVVEVIRQWRAPHIFVCPPYDRHPDHQGASKLVQSAYFLARLPKYETESPAFSPKRLLYYFIHDMRNVSFAVDISDYFDLKQQAMAAYSSQFINPDLPPDYQHIGISDYLKQVEAFNRSLGAQIGAAYAEGFASDSPFGLSLPTECA